MTEELAKVPFTEYILDLEQKVYRALRSIVPRVWLDVDLTVPRLKVMLPLFTDGPARMSILASDLGVSLATTTGIVDRLVEREFSQTQARGLLETMTPAKLQLISDALKTTLQAASGTGEDAVTEQYPNEQTSANHIMQRRGGTP